MQGYYIKKMGQNRGAPRVWLEGTQTERAGFAPGQRYDLEVQGKMIVLQANNDGSRVVSGKLAGEKNNPIIDINSKSILAIFDGMAAIRVIVKKDQILLLPLASEIKKVERYASLRRKLENGEPLEVGSVSHGGGVLSHALHSGLNAVGIKTRLAFANEIDGDLLEHASTHNDIWADDTQILAAPMQELAFDSRGLASVKPVDIIEIGIPCSGASKAGRSKRGLVHPEAHPLVGHLVVSALIIIGRANPAVVTIENVVEYSNSASADILRSQLAEMGYRVHERILRGKEWDSLEGRNRWCMLAITEGIEFDFDQLIAPGETEMVVDDIVDKDIALDDERWREYSYLKEKEVRDASKGNSFAMQVVAGNDKSIGVLRKGYSKAGSTDPLLQHPENPNLLRQFTKTEHANIKKIPRNLIEGLSSTKAHELLGQSILYEPFKALGSHIGNSLNKFAGREEMLTSIQPRGKVHPLIEITKSGGGEAVQFEIAQSHMPRRQQQLDLLDSLVSEGRHSGLILSIENGTVTQKVSRDGRTALHDVRTLSDSIGVGEVVDINYSDGVGMVLKVGKILER